VGAFLDIQKGAGGRMEQLLTSEQVGEILGLHPKVIERYAKRGEIPAFKLGKFWRYRASALDSWVTARLESNRQACRIETSF
jgi:excisionase family DNA binding protein